MPLTVIAGGQFGSEGKGKVAHYFAERREASAAVRVGGSNSGHTIVDQRGKTHVFRVLPTAAVLDRTICVLGAGSYVAPELLFEEMRRTELPAERVWIDPNAFVLSDQHRETEQRSALGDRIGSTQSGTGAAVIERIERLSASHLAQNDSRLAPFVRPVRTLLRELMRHGEHVIVEGTQGFGLSLLHSPHYPKATSRDTTAAAFVAEAGLNPLDVLDVVLVIRAFPIRVAGDSGRLPNEVDWQTIAREGGWESSLVEYTSVTKKVRRVARFDPSIVKEAIVTNAPTCIVLNHVDYIDATMHNSSRLNSRGDSFVKQIEADLQCHIDLVGLGPGILVSPGRNVRLTQSAERARERTP